MKKYLSALALVVLMVLFITSGAYATSSLSSNRSTAATSFEQVKALAESMRMTHLTPLKSEIGKRLGNVIVGSKTPPKPFSPDITCTLCVADGSWEGTTYGGLTESTVDTPGINNSSGFYFKYLNLFQTTGSKSLQIGEVVAKGSPGVACHKDGQGLDDHYFVVGYDGFSNKVYSCVSIPTTDSNKHTFYEAYFTSNCNFDGGSPDEMAVVVDSPSVGLVINGCVDTETPSYTEEQLYVRDYDTFTNHHVWGGDWVNTSYTSVDASFHAQTRDFDHSSADNPVQMYWNVVPSVGNPGGQLYSCSYPSGTTCIPGH